jgi:heat shock protein HtpX
MRFQRRSKLLARRPRAVLVAEIDGVEFVRARPRPTNDRLYRRLAVLPLIGGGVWSAALATQGRAILGVTSALVLFEFALANWRLAGITRGAADDLPLAERVAPLLRQLCYQARCDVPRVSLRADAVRTAAVIWSRRRPVLILSCEFGHRLTDDELRGILAHEVAHLAYGDLDAARQRGRFAYGASLLAVIATMAVVPNVNGLLPLPIWLGMWIIGSVMGRLVVAPLNRPRETRADAYAAVLCADPEAVGRALEEVRATSERTRSALFGRPPLSWLLAPVSWRMPSHPPMAQRIARLNANVFSAAMVLPPSPRGGKPLTSRPRYVP